MREVEYPARSVVEKAQQQHQPRHQERYIPRADNHARVFRLPPRRAQGVGERLGRTQVFDDIEQQDVLERSRVQGKPAVVEIALHELIETGLGERRELVDARDLAVLVLEGARHVPGGTPHIDHLRPWLDACQGERVGAFEAPLGLVEEVHSAGGDVEVTLIEDAEVLRPRQERTFHHVPRVFHAVDVADLVAVIGGNRQFPDAHSGAEQLDDDLCIEMKIVGVPAEGQLLQSFDRVKTVSGVEFGEVGMEVWGASFPLALAAAADREGDPGRLVGGIYAANTGGAIVGALGSSLILVPWIGTGPTQAVLIATLGVSGMLMVLPLGRSPFTRILAAGAAAGIVALLAETVSPPPGMLIAYGRRIMISLGRSEVLYTGEGINSSIAITRWDDGGVDAFAGVEHLRAAERD